MGIKRPGTSMSPCCTCRIQGVPLKTGRGSTYYVPHLDRVELPSLPIRENLRTTIDDVHIANRADLYMQFGIRDKYKSISLELPSLHFPRSFPADMMHCVLQNITPMLFRLWNEEKLKIDKEQRPQYSLLRRPAPGTPTYISKISDTLQKSRAHIPSYLGHAPRSIDKHYNSFKAAEWDAWLCLFSLPLLHQALPRPYVRNFRMLSQLYDLSAHHQMKGRDVQRLGKLAADFVVDFERLYYCGDSNRISVCTVQIHYLLHLEQYIQDTGPACYWWQFTMERYCGFIKPQARSKSQLDMSVTNAVLVFEHLKLLQLSGLIESPTIDKDYPALLGRISSTSLPTRHKNRLQQTFGRADNFEMYQRLRLRENLTVGSTYSHRSDDSNRLDNKVAYDLSGVADSWRFAQVDYFLQVHSSSDIWACIRRYEHARIDKDSGMTSYCGIGRKGLILAKLTSYLK